MINYIKTHKRELYLLLVSIFWVLIYIYVRFIVERRPYDLEMLKLHVTLKYLLFQCTFLVLHLTLIFYHIANIMNGSLIKNTFWVTNEIKLLLNKIIIEPLNYLRQKIGPEIPGSGMFFCKIMELIIKYNIDPAKITTIFFYAFPRIFVASVFFIEIVIVQKIQYFFLSLTLLIIPVLWTIFINLFTDFGKRILDDMPRLVEVIGLGKPLENGWHSEYMFKEKPEYSYEENDLEQYAETWSICMKIYGYGENFLKAFQSKINPYVSLTCSLLYFNAILFKIIILVPFIF